MARVKALIFDMDGTIVDNMSYHTDTWLELLRRHSIETTAEEFFGSTAGMPNPLIFRHYFGETLSDADVARLGDEKECVYRESYGPHVKAVDGFHELMEAARSKGIKTGLATSAPPENIAFILEKADLLESFDIIVGASDITHGKPHPEIYLVCAEKLGVQPEECLVFEDAPMGIESGVNAGMRVFVLTTVLSDEEARRIRGVEGTMSDFRPALDLLD